MIYRCWKGWFVSIPMVIFASILCQLAYTFAHGGTLQLNTNADDGSLLAMAHVLRQRTKRHIIIVIDDPPARVPKIPSEGSMSSILNSVADSLGMGWQEGPQESIILSVRLRALTMEKILKTRLQGERIYGFIALPKLFEIIGEQGKRALQRGEQITFKKGEAGYELVKTLAMLCPPAGKHITQANMFQLRIYPDPYLAFYAEPGRVPGFVAILYPRLSPDWLGWTGDTEKSPLFALDKVLRTLDSNVKLDIKADKPLTTEDVATYLERATGKQWRVDRRLQKFKILLTLPSWELKDFVRMLCRALHAGVREIEEIMFIYAKPYHYHVHRWLDEQMIKLLSPIFKEACKHCGICPEYLNMSGYRLGEMKPVIRFEPFSKRDYVEGREYTWAQLTEEQRKFFDEILPKQWHQWVGAKEKSLSRVRCLPGIIMSITLMYDSPGKRYSLFTCNIPFH